MALNNHATYNPLRDPLFQSWWKTVVLLAAKRGFDPGDPRSWVEYHQDGDTPDEALKAEGMGCAG